MITPVILCGGSGTRLWPLSRAMYPKQFHRMVGENTLLGDTIRRLRGIEGAKRPMAICNTDFRFLTAEQFRCQHVEDFILLLEPNGRNTAPALAAAACQVLDKGLPSTLLVLPADHVIADPEGFSRAVETALPEAQAGAFVTFGVVPKSAETGYGYIKTVPGPGHIRLVERFVEKPGEETARDYVDSGEFFWNSGMFLFDARAYLDALDQFAPEIATYACEASRKARECLETVFLDQENFDKCPSISIDYAVMEHTDRAMMVPLDAGWCDVGSWKGVWQASDHDEHGNVAVGDVMLSGVTNSCVFTEDRLVVVNALKDVAVIDTRDATYVTSLDASQSVRDVVMKLRDQKRSEVDLHPRVHRPWGSFETLDVGQGFQVKRLVVNPGSEISLQYHHHRSEHWVVVRGVANVVRGDDSIELSQNESVYIPAGLSHKLSNPGNLPLEVIEVQTGSYLGEDDIVRLEDTYGRIEET